MNEEDTMDVLEHCARALHQRDVDDPRCEPDQREWDRLTVFHQDEYRADAKAVLDAANHQRAVEEREWLAQFGAQARGWTVEQVKAAMARDLAAARARLGGQ